MIKYPVTLCLLIVAGNSFMRNGKISWMKTSFRRMNMEWFLYAGTMSRGDYFPEYSHTRQTIQKGRALSHVYVRLLKTGHRVLIANIRNLGQCPCPRCLIPKVKFQEVATENDILQCAILARCDTEERREKISSARQLIYEGQYVIDTPRVETLLKPESLVPTVVRVLICTEISHNVPQNAFSARLGHTKFNFFLMLVVDLLHEFELGVWKSILIHLLRILDSLKGTVLAELDCR